MTRFHIFRLSFVCAWLAASVSVKADDPAQHSPGAKFSANLEQMLASVKISSYEHRTDIDVPAGRFNCDCSGLLGYALRTSFPEAYLALQGDLAPWKSRPLAVTFYETFDRAGEEGDGLWKKIPHLADARPGDLLAWRKPQLEKGKTTGHVLMIAGLPKVESDGRIRVRVIDSTDKPHENDTRRDGGSGLGAGEMRFEVDETGQAVAFIRHKDSGRIDSNLILIGRLQSGKEAAATTIAVDRDLIELNEEAAAKLAKERGLDWRIIKRDGVVSPVSLSRPNPKRLNVVIEDGKVARIRRG